MRYRAQLFGVPDLERPVQMFGNRLSDLQTWAEGMVQRYVGTHSNAHVRVFESVEREVGRVSRWNVEAVTGEKEKDDEVTA